MKDEFDDKTLDMFEDKRVARIELLLDRLSNMEHMNRICKDPIELNQHPAWVSTVKELKELGYEEPETPRPLASQDAEGQG